MMLGAGVGWRAARGSNMAHNIYYVPCFLCVGIHDWNVIFGFFLGSLPCCVGALQRSAICNRVAGRECVFLLVFVWWPVHTFSAVSKMVSMQRLVYLLYKSLEL